MKYPDTLTFTNPSVDTEQKTVTISTDDIEQKLPTGLPKDSDVI